MAEIKKFTVSLSAEDYGNIRTSFINGINHRNGQIYTNAAEKFLSSPEYLNAMSNFMKTPEMQQIMLTFMQAHNSNIKRAAWSEETNILYTLHRLSKGVYFQSIPNADWSILKKFYDSLVPQYNSYTYQQFYEYFRNSNYVPWRV